LFINGFVAGRGGTAVEGGDERRRSRHRKGTYNTQTGSLGDIAGFDGYEGTVRCNDSRGSIYRCRRRSIDDLVMDRVILHEARYCDGDPGGSGG
jgi:hypothetical protein